MSEKSQRAGFINSRGLEIGAKREKDPKKLRYIQDKTRDSLAYLAEEIGAYYI